MGRCAPRASPSAAALTACGPSGPSLELTVSSGVFATTGGNLFNCTSPTFPPNRHTLRNDKIVCTPKHGSQASEVITVTDELACGDGHGALVVVTCTTDAAGNIDGSVSISITSSCGDKTPASNADAFTFSGLALGSMQSQSVASCAAFTNFCPSGDGCGFNQFNGTANLSVTP
jgi:hypothetical protein